MSRPAQRTYYICNIIPGIKSTQFRRRLSYRLYDQSDCPGLDIGSSNRKRNTLALLADSHDNKMTCFTSLRNQRGFYDKLYNFFRKIFFRYNPIHRFLYYLSFLQNYKFPSRKIPRTRTIYVHLSFINHAKPHPIFTSHAKMLNFNETPIPYIKFIPAYTSITIHPNYFKKE